MSSFLRRTLLHTRQIRKSAVVMMKSIILGTFLLFVLCGAVSGLGSVVQKGYSYITEHYSWSGAQQYCSTSHVNGHLAIIYTQSDADDLNLANYKAWLGLRKPPGDDDFSWSHSPHTSYRRWPNSQSAADRSSDYCVVSYYSSLWFYRRLCDTHAFFICCQCHNNPARYFVSQSKTWTEALDYCKNVYHNMPSFADLGDLDNAFQLQDFPVWTGLYRHGGSWKWIKGSSEYRNWSNNEPQDNGNCVSISSLGKRMSVQDCSAHFPFVCFHDNLVLVKENKTWEEALEHCRTLGSHRDLVSVQPGSDQDYIMRRVMEADTEKVWTGLRFLAGQWLWVNQADMLYSDLPVCPVDWQHCGALSKDDGEHIEIRECSERRNFLCYN